MQKTPKRVLVTGATGNVGTPLVRALLAARVAVRAASRRPAEVRDRFPDQTGEQLQAVGLDFTDPATWPEAYAGIETMFLLRPPHLGRPKSQMIPSLEAARGFGLRHVVLLSLQGAEHNRFVPHYALEQWLRSSGLTWTFVRASFFMQNLTTTHLTDVRDRNRLMVPAGDGATAFVDAADVAAVGVAAMLNPPAHRNAAWTPTGPDSLTYQQVSDILSDVLERPIGYGRPGLVRYARHARSELGMPWGMVGVTTAIYTAARLGRADGLTDDVRTVTGSEPTSFRQFAERERAAWSR